MTSVPSVQGTGDHAGFSLSIRQFPSAVVNQRKWDRSGPEKIIVMKN